MSREIKFRAWDNTKKEWTLNIMECVSSSTGNIWMEPALKSHKVIIEQYTGLKDKNGKEIYEGDIVRTKSPDRANFNAGAIEMVQQMYIIMNSAHYCDPEISHCEPLGYYCVAELEIIGNIHENPELLGGEE